MWQRILLGTLGALFWGISLWLFAHRERPDQVNNVLPLMRRQRESRLHPLFAGTLDILALSGLFFALGFVLLVIVAEL